MGVELRQDDIPIAIASCTDKPIVEARFHLTEVHSFQAYGDSGFGTAKSVIVTMTAAKSGIFGKASPNGKLEIHIANPGAYTVFEKAFDEAARRVYDPDFAAPKMGSKRFRIYIVEDEDQAPG
jgi:hypothetical protein